MTDEARARAKQLVLAINEISEQQWDHGDERDLERILAFARDERRRMWECVLHEAMRHGLDSGMSFVQWLRHQAEAPHG